MVSVRMRVVLAVLAAFIVGFVGGGYAPRSDLERTRVELAEAQRRAQELERRGPPAWAAGLGQLMQAQAAMAQRAPSSSGPSPVGAQPAPPDLAPPAGAARRDQHGDDDDDDADRGSPDGGSR